VEIFKGVKIDLKCDCKKIHFNSQVYINNDKYFVICSKTQNEVDITDDMNKFMKKERAV
jgi:hypothetical protein